VIGNVTPADQEAEREGRAFARALLANGDIRPTGDPATEDQPKRRRVRGGRPRFEMAPTPRPNFAPFPPTHEVRMVNGEPTLSRVGFSAHYRTRRG
jgi:hypothetical protein